MIFHHHHKCLTLHSFAHRTVCGVWYSILEWKLEIKYIPFFFFVKKKHCTFAYYNIVIKGCFSNSFNQTTTLLSSYFSTVCMYVCVYVRELIIRIRTLELIFFDYCFSIICVMLKFDVDVRVLHSDDEMLLVVMMTTKRRRWRRQW